jgi:hypothetical protein
VKVSPKTRAAVLSEALPHLQRFAGKVIVVKYGGNALADSSEDSMEVFARDIALLHAVGMKPVVVHGGGPQITAMMDRLGKEARFHNGLRVTDAETIEIVSMVLLGSVNPMFVSLINQSGANAAGVSGNDVGLFQCVQRDPALGFVGDIVSVNPMAVQGLLDAWHRRVGPELQHQRRHGSERVGGGIEGREDSLSHRHCRGAAKPCRPRVDHRNTHSGDGRATHQRWRDQWRHDPQT